MLLLGWIVSGISDLGDFRQTQHPLGVGEAGQFDQNTPEIDELDQGLYGTPEFFGLRQV